MVPQSRSARTARLRDAQRDWLNDVILKDDARGTVLSTTTIAAIAEATGETPPGDLVAIDAPKPAAATRDADSYRGDGGAMGDAVRAIIGGDPNISSWRMRSDLLALAGVRPGDVMIVSQGVAPRDGDVVCAQVESGFAAQTVFRLFRSPWLVAAGLDPMGPKPDFVDGERVRVVGVMTGLVRARAA